MIWSHVIAVAVGGAGGSVLRYLMGGAVHKLAGKTSLAFFPWGTLSVNLLGCFAIGLCFELFASRTLTDTTRVFVLIGVLGGFTTFSSFGIETVNLLRDNQLRLALANLLISNFGGLALVMLGILAARGLMSLMGHRL